MARAFLAEAGLPKRYWFWAVREATMHMNMLPVKAGPSLDDKGAFQAIPSAEADLLLYWSNPVSQVLRAMAFKRTTRGRSNFGELMTAKIS
jgi:hypothetical protein